MGRRVVVTGGLGLLGRRILRGIFSTDHGREHEAAARVLVVDHENDLGEELKSDLARDGMADAVSFVGGDFATAEVAAAIKRFASGGAGAAGDAGLSVFHLASVMSGQGESDFDQALRVNVAGTRSLLEICRDIGGRPRFVFASSIAAFGGGAEVSDETKLLPQSTYGMTKACAELLVNDCTRKGFVDGRIARLPTVIIRPGPPNPAATGCFSSVPKAVLHGQHFVSPVSPDLGHACIGLSSAVKGLIRLHDAPEVHLDARDRAVTLPAVSLTLRDLEISASKLAKNLGMTPGTVSYEPDASIECVVDAMPSAVRVSSTALGLGLHPDTGPDAIVYEYARGGGVNID